MDLTNQLISEIEDDSEGLSDEQCEAALKQGQERYACVIAECKTIREPYALVVAHDGGVSIYNNCADADEPHSLNELMQLTIAMAYGTGGLIGTELGDEAVFTFAGRLAAAAVDE
jgi:hypothetical protein